MHQKNKKSQSAHDSFDRLAIKIGLVSLCGIVAVVTVAIASLRQHRGPRLFTQANSLSDPKWEQMTTELEDMTKKHPGKVSIYLKDLRSKRSWTHEADSLFPSASLIKVPIMAAIFDKIKSGTFGIDSMLTLAKTDRKGGSGRIKWQRSGAAFSVGELLYYMITESDNTATEMLMKHVGIDYL